MRVLNISFRELGREKAHRKAHAVHDALQALLLSNAAQPL